MTSFYRSNMIGCLILTNQSLIFELLLCGLPVLTFLAGKYCARVQAEVARHFIYIVELRWAFLLEKLLYMVQENNRFNWKNVH